MYICGWQFAEICMQSSTSCPTYYHSTYMLSHSGSAQVNYYLWKYPHNELLNFCDKINYKFTQINTHTCSCVCLSSCLNLDLKSLAWKYDTLLRNNISFYWGLHKIKYALYVTWQILVYVHLIYVKNLWIYFVLIWLQFMRQEKSFGLILRCMSYIILLFFL
jgi:hypothetical protein